MHGNEKFAIDIMLNKPNKTDSPEIKTNKEKNRKVQIELLHNNGDYNHNRKVWASGEGEIILVRQLSNSFNPDDF